MNFLKRFKHTFHITFWEAIIAMVTIAVFFILRYTVSHISMPIIILGFVVGAWLAFRPSEWAVTGLNSGAKYVGLSEYVAGILSSLASNLPEAVIAVLLILKGEELIAVITVLSAAGFNTLILAMAIIMATWKTWKIKVPEDLEKKEAPIIRWAIVAMLMTVVFGFIEYVHALSSETLTLKDAQLTRPVSALLALSYIFYLIYVVVKKDNNGDERLKLETESGTEKNVEHNEEKKEEETDGEHDLLSVPFTIFFLVMGFVGIFFGGETLTWCVEEILHGSLNIELSNITIALILGAAGAVPEHGIAIISAAKNEVDVALGNAIGGILQSSLLIFGILGTIISITLHPFILLQLAAIGG
ncbi:MAG: hypothetical protein ACTSPI_17135, partial [Candidatus Heimdallarchaeaceae archaeon]